MSKPRLEVVQFLSDEVMSAIADSGVEDLTPAEVLSASFTTCKRIMEGVLENSTKANLEHNKQVMLSALAEMFKIINPTIN